MTDVEKLETKLQPQLEDIKRRIDAVEKAELSLRIQSVGARGPIGPSGHLGGRGERGERSPMGANGANGANGLNGRDGEVNKNQIDAQILEILKDYGLLSEIGPLKKFVERL